MAESRPFRRMRAPANGRAEAGITPSVLYRAVLLAFALVALVLIFPVLATLLLLVLLVVVVAVPMSAATDRLERVHIPRGVGAPLCLLAGLGVIAGIGALLVPVFISEGNHFVRSLPSIVDSLRRDIGGPTTRPGHAGADLKHWVTGLAGHPQKLLGPATTIGAGLAGALTALVAVLITTVYTAVRPRSLVDGAIRLVSPPQRDHARHIMGRLAHAYMGWVRGVGVAMLVLWIITYIGLRLVGLPYALVFATLTAVATVVPYFGAVVSSIPPILLALTISPGKALIVAAIYVFSHQVEGHLVQPLVMARAVELHPALIAVGVLAVERLFGPIALIVAVPILVTFKILVEELWVRPMERRYERQGIADARPPPVERSESQPLAGG